MFWMSKVYRVLREACAWECASDQWRGNGYNAWLETHWTNVCALCPAPDFVCMRFLSTVAPCPTSFRTHALCWSPTARFGYSPTGSAVAIYSAHCILACLLRRPWGKGWRAAWRLRRAESALRWRSEASASKTMQNL
jgi:hypothetical protein